LKLWTFENTQKTRRFNTATGIAFL